MTVFCVCVSPDCRSGSRQGVDPRQLAAQLEEIKEIASPENSPSSQQDFLTPRMPSPCSTPRSDPASSSSSHRQRVHVIQIEPNSSFSRQAVGGQTSSKSGQTRSSSKGGNNQQMMPCSSSDRKDDSSAYVGRSSNDKAEPGISSMPDPQIMFEKVSPSARRRTRTAEADPPPPPVQKAKSRIANLIPEPCVKRVDSGEDFDSVQYETHRSNRSAQQNSSFRDRRQLSDESDQNFPSQSKHKTRSHSCRVPRSKQEKGGEPVSKDDQYLSSSKHDKQPKPSPSPKVPSSRTLPTPQQTPKVREQPTETHPKPTPRRRATSKADQEGAAAGKDSDKKTEVSSSSGLKVSSHDAAMPTGSGLTKQKSKKMDKRKQAHSEENDVSIF